jgi:hypothetical protein
VVRLPSGKIFLFETSKPGLDPTQPPVQCVPGDLSSWLKRPRREADRFHLVLRLRVGVPYAVVACIRTTIPIYHKIILKT